MYRKTEKLLIYGQVGWDVQGDGTKMSLDKVRMEEKPHHTRKTWTNVFRGSQVELLKHMRFAENDLDCNITSAPSETSILYVGVGRARKDLLEAIPIECDCGAVFITGHLAAIRGSFR